MADQCSVQYGLTTITAVQTGTTSVVSTTTLTPATTSTTLIEIDNPACPTGTSGGPRFVLPCTPRFLTSTSTIVVPAVVSEVTSVTTTFATSVTTSSYPTATQCPNGAAPAAAPSAAITTPAATIAPSANGAVINSSPRASVSAGIATISGSSGSAPAQQSVASSSGTSTPLPASSGPPIAAIAGGAAGGIAVLLLLLAGCLVHRRRRQRREAAPRWEPEVYDTPSTLDAYKYSSASSGLTSTMTQSRGELAYATYRSDASQAHPRYDSPSTAYDPVPSVERPLSTTSAATSYPGPRRESSFISSPTSLPTSASTTHPPLGLETKDLVGGGDAVYAAQSPKSSIIGASNFLASPVSAGPSGERTSANAAPPPAHVDNLAEHANDIEGEPAPPAYRDVA